MSEPTGEHIHTGSDGRGMRRVLVDGVEQATVLYADTQLGYALVVVNPIRVYPGTDYIDTDVIFGCVVVEPMGEA